MSDNVPPAKKDGNARNPFGPRSNVFASPRSGIGSPRPTLAIATNPDMENSTSVLAKILMGCTVIFLIGVLVRLIQVRTRRNAMIGGAMEIGGGIGGSFTSGMASISGGSCCYLPTTMAILLCGLVMVYLLYASRKAKEQQRAENMTWNMVAGVVLVIGIMLLMEFSLVQHHMGFRPKEEAKTGILAYFIIAIAALAAAKISNRIQHRIREKSRSVNARKANY